MKVAEIIIIVFFLSFDDDEAHIAYKQIYDKHARRTGILKLQCHYMGFWNENEIVSDIDQVYFSTFQRNSLDYCGSLA